MAILGPTAQSCGRAPHVNLKTVPMAIALVLSQLGPGPAKADAPLLPIVATTTTVPANGDLNPYGVAFVPSTFSGGGTPSPGRHPGVQLQRQPQSSRNRNDHHPLQAVRRCGRARRGRGLFPGADGSAARLDLGFGRAATGHHCGRRRQHHQRKIEHHPRRTAARRQPRWKLSPDNPAWLQYKN
jgi:hypothetical protein